MRAVNLLPRELSQSAGPRPGTVLIGAAAAATVVAGCLVLAGYMLEHSTVRDRHGKLEAVERQLASAPARSSARPGVSTITSEREARQAALEAVLLDRVPWDRAFVDLARVLPSDVWLTDLDVTSPTPADSTSSASDSSSEGFSIQGTAASQDAVAQLLERLQLLPMLSQVTLGQTSSSTSTGGESLVQFSITAAIVSQAGGSANAAASELADGSQT